MAKRAVVPSKNRSSANRSFLDSSSDNPKLARVNDLIAQLSLAIVDLLGDFIKVTTGKRSVADYSLEFIKEAFQGTVDFPEILAQSFNKDDFGKKQAALVGFFTLQAVIYEAINKKWETNLMICKTDALSYANEFYGIVQREAAKDVKYQPLLETLKAYYKKTKQDASKNPATPKPPTT